MSKLRRIHLLLMALTLTIFGAAFSAEVCSLDCFLYANACGVSDGGGGGLPTPTPTPLPQDPPIQRLATGVYSYGDTTTNCTGALSNVVDPISIVVHLDRNAAVVLGWPLFASEHIAHHGWGTGDPPLVANGQFFQSGGGVTTGCTEGDISLADGNFTTSRYHTRGFDQADVVTWGYGGQWWMTPLTPHYEKRISLTCWHAVPQSVDPPGLPEYSGFSAARNALISHWLLDAGAQHRYVLQAAFWDNTKRTPQCNGDQPQSDGWVYFLGMCEVRGTTVTPC